MLISDTPLTRQELFDLEVDLDPRKYVRDLKSFTTESAGSRAVMELADGVVQLGRPGKSFVDEAVFTRTLAERRRTFTERLDEAQRKRALNSTTESGYRPDELLLGTRPTLITSLGKPRSGISSRGTRTILSEEPHSTIIDGESRSLIYPNTFPYTAVCKLYSRWQQTPGGPWLATGQATGFMIGRSTMMTSGHVGPRTDGAGWMIEVIPACWNGQSLFGPGAISYVETYRSWNSDSGSDIKICKLYDPLGDRTGYFGYRGYNSAWEDGEYWAMAGFPFDINLTHMSHEVGIAVRDDDDGDDINVDGTTYDTTQVESDADEASGVSGAPLWGWWGEQIYAIGVHHGVEHDGTVFGTETLSCASGGAGFTQAAAWGRRLWG
jgi:V8-like Glu-specific endopeptidase